MGEWWRGRRGRGCRGRAELELEMSSRDDLPSFLRLLENFAPFCSRNDKDKHCRIVMPGVGDEGMISSQLLERELNSFSLLPLPLLPPSNSPAGTSFLTHRRVQFSFERSDMSTLPSPPSSPGRNPPLRSFREPKPQPPTTTSKSWNATRTEPRTLSSKQTSSASTLSSKTHPM